MYNDTVCCHLISSPRLALLFHSERVSIKLKYDKSVIIITYVKGMHYIVLYDRNMIDLDSVCFKNDFKADIHVYPYVNLIITSGVCSK